MRPDSTKLFQLRSKTDRQLVELIMRKLEAAARVAGLGDIPDPVEGACEEARRLLPLVPRSDRRRIEARIQELGEMLHPTARAACF